MFGSAHVLHAEKVWVGCWLYWDYIKPRVTFVAKMLQAGVMADAGVSVA